MEDHLAHDLWVSRQQPEAAVALFLGAEAHAQGPKPDLGVTLARAKGHGPGSVSPGVLALTDELSGADEDTWAVLITQAARAFRAAQTDLTDRLGPGMDVEVDEETWVPVGLPAPVLGEAFCTTSLVAAWALGENAWGVLEVHQEKGDWPIAVVLYRVDG